MPISKLNKPAPSHVLKRLTAANGFVNPDSLNAIGFGGEQLKRAILATYRLLDRIDATLIEDGVEPLCQVVELANLSSMIGNIFGAELAKCSNGLYRRNGPHKFPELLPAGAGATEHGIEIKMAMNRNKPKGHLVKPGHYLTCRYILIDAEGGVITEKADKPKADKPVFWEIRTGFLTEQHFNVSNTAGDSGKTAVVNEDGMKSLHIVYVDLDMFPGSQRGPAWAACKALVSARD